MYKLDCMLLCIKTYLEVELNKIIINNMLISSTPEYVYLEKTSYGNL